MIFDVYFIRYNWITQKGNTPINRYFYLHGKDKYLHRQNKSANAINFRNILICNAFQKNTLRLDKTKEIAIV